MTSSLQSTIRPAAPEDLDQIQQISAWYVENTVINLMHRPPSKQSIQSIYQATLTRNLPYLVAVDSNNQVQGYAYTGPFPSTRLAYAHTLELSIFVAPHTRKQGIGSNLLRAILESLRTNPHHAFEPGYESESEIQKAYARKLIAKMSYDRNGPERETSQALRMWYAKFGFTEVGTIKDVGFKFGRFVDTMDHVLDLEQYYVSVGASVAHLKE